MQNPKKWMQRFKWIVLSFLLIFPHSAQPSHEKKLNSKNVRRVESAYSDKNSIKIHRREDGEVFLRGSDCTLLLGQVHAFIKIKEANGEDVSKLKKVDERLCLSKTKSSEVEINVTSFLPSFIQKYHGKQSICDGPNCWGTALAVSNVLPFSGYTHETEFMAWLNSPICRFIPPEEKVQPGDIIAKKGTTGAHEEHAFVYVSEQLAVAKGGVRKKYAFEITNLDEAFRQAFSDGFVERHKTAPTVQSKSKDWVRVYRCTNLEKYLKKELPKAAAYLDQTLKEMNEIADALARHTLGIELLKNPRDLESFIQEMLDKTLRYLSQNQNLLSPEQQEGASAVPHWVWSGLSMRCFSYLKQFNYIMKSKL